MHRQIGSFPQVTDENLEKIYLKPPPRKSENCWLVFVWHLLKSAPHLGAQKVFSRPGSISLQPPYHSF